MQRLLLLGLCAIGLFGTAAELAPEPRTQVLRPGLVTVAGVLGAGGVLELDVAATVEHTGCEALTELAVEDAPKNLAGQHVQVSGRLALEREPRLLHATFR